MSYLNISWVADELMESHLAIIGAKWEIKKFKLSDFDTLGSRQAQTRLDTHVDDKHALDLAESITQSKIIKRLVCVPALQGFKGIMIPDGVHRHRSVEILVDCGDLPQNVEIEAYFVDTQDTQLRDVIGRTCNIVGVKKVVKDEHIVRHAQELMTVYGMTIAQLAIYFHQDVKSLSGKLSFEVQKKELREEGHINVDKLAVGTIKELNRIKGNKNLKFKTAALCSQFPAEAAGPVVKRMVSQVVKKCTDEGETAAVECLVKWRSDLSSTTKVPEAPKKRGKRNTHRTEFLRNLKALRNLLLEGNNGEAYTTLAELDMTDVHEVARIWKVWKDVHDTVEAMHANYKKTTGRGS